MRRLSARSASRAPDGAGFRLLAALVVAGLLWVAVILGSDRSVSVTDPLSGHLAWAQDARSYFGFDYRNLYAGRTDWNAVGAYPYSPAFAQLIWPLNQLPWPLFVATWTGLLLGAVFLLTGPELAIVGLIVGAMEIAGGNVSLLLTLAIVAGFRWPATWALVLLTKITPGIGLLWFAFRREWRALSIALAATAAIVVVSVVIAPGLWRDWIDLLIANAGKSGTWAAIPVPLWVRLPAAMLLIAWGAPRNQRWVVPIAAMLALPALWYGSLAMVLGVIPLTTEDERRRAWERVVGFVRADGGLAGEA
jgi:hypothetical protein